MELNRLARKYNGSHARHRFAWGIQQLMNRDVKQPDSHACRRACSSCCWRLVRGLPGEGTIAVDYLINHRPGAINDVVKRITSARNFVRKHRHLPGAQIQLLYRQEQRPCPFLDVSGGVCHIYHARPLACRAMHSLDATACLKQKVDPATTTPVPQDAEYHELMRRYFNRWRASSNRALVPDFTKNTTFIVMEAHTHATYTVKKSKPESRRFAGAQLKVHRDEK